MKKKSAGLKGQAWAKLYAVPLMLQNNETITGAKTTVPLTKSDRDGEAVGYAVKSGGASVVDSGGKLWLKQQGTVTASEDGEQTIALTNAPLYDAVTVEGDFYRQKATGDFSGDGSGLSRNAAVKNNVNTYGSTSANANVYMEMTGSSGNAYSLKFTNAAAYTTTDTRYFQLKVYRNTDKTMYDYINVTLKPMESFTLDMTFTVANAGVNANTAEGHTVSYSGQTTATSRTKAPVDLALSKVAGELPVKTVEEVPWETTKQSLTEAGVSLELVNVEGKTAITEREFDPKAETAPVFATVGAGKSVDYRFRLHHPKLVSQQGSYRLNLTYRVSVCASDTAS